MKIKHVRDRHAVTENLLECIVNRPSHFLLFVFFFFLYKETFYYTFFEIDVSESASDICVYICFDDDDKFST